jgi:hypothetical protein
MADAVPPGVGRARNAGEAFLNFLTTNQITPQGVFPYMIRKLKAGGYRLYSRKKDARTGKRKNLDTFSSRAAAEKHERAVQHFKRARVAKAAVYSAALTALPESLCTDTSLSRPYFAATDSVRSPLHRDLVL